MKNILIPFLLLTINTAAQDSTCYEKKYDKFNGKINYQLKDVIDINENTTFWAYTGAIGTVNKKMITLKIVCSKIITVDDKSTVTFIFSDSSKLQLKSADSYNLNGVFYLQMSDMKMLGYAKKLTQFLSNRITAIRIHGFKDVEDYDIAEQKGAEIKEKMNCLYKEWIKKRDNEK